PSRPELRYTASPYALDFRPFSYDSPMPNLDLRRLILLLCMSATSLVLAYFLYASYHMQRELLIKQTLEANRIYAVKLAEVTENFLNTARKQLAYSASVIGQGANTPKLLDSEVDRLLLQ